MDDNLRWVLVVDGREVVILAPEGSPYRLGRGHEADIALAGNTTSRHHARLEWRQGDGWMVVDAGARNGTLVGGEPLRGARILVDGDVLHAGGSELRFHLLPAGLDPNQLIGRDPDQASGTISVDALQPRQEELAGPVRGGDVRTLLRFFAVASKRGRLELALADGRVARIELVDGLPRRARVGDTTGFRALRLAVGVGADSFAFTTAVVLDELGPTIDADAAGLFYDLAEDHEPHDLRQAEHVQRHLLRPPPTVAGYDLAVHFQPRSGVGGDLYECHQRADGRLLLFLGDVAGHGVQAALGMATVLKSLRRHAELGSGIEILKALNREVASDLVAGQFVTAWLGLLEPASGHLESHLAGHHPPLVIAANGQARPLAGRGMALGITGDDAFAATLAADEIVLGPGQRLLQYSDALVESTDPTGRSFTLADLHHRFPALAATAADSWVAAIAEAVTNHAGALDDDLTLLLVDRPEPSRTVGEESSGHRQSIDTRVTPPGRRSGGPRATASTDLGSGPETATYTDPVRLLPERRVAMEPGRADYRLGEEVGRGGMGMVHKAVQRGAGRTVALKHLLDERMRRSDQQRFLTEALVVASLDHPHILPVHDVGWDRDLGPFYTMPLLAGRTLAQAHAGMDEETILDHVEAIADALAYAHDHGVLHRDLKPSNVLIGDYGEVYLVDWGLAAAIGDLPAQLRGMLAPPRSGRIVGTPAYMPPEQARGEATAIDQRSDVYLLGGLLLELTTGCVPHEGSSASACLAAARANLLPPLDQDDPLQGLIARALATDQHQRPQSAAAFRRLLVDWRHQRQALAIVRAAEADLAEARVDGGFRLLERAVHGFEQALMLSADSSPAREGLTRARAAYAEAALDQGELELAASQLEAEHPSHARLRQRLERLRSQKQHTADELNRLRDLAAETERRWTAVIDTDLGDGPPPDWHWMKCTPTAPAPGGGGAIVDCHSPGGLVGPPIAGDQALTVDATLSTHWVTQLGLWLVAAHQKVSNTCRIEVMVSLGRHCRVQLKADDRILGRTTLPKNLVRDRRCRWRLARVGDQAVVERDGHLVIAGRLPSGLIAGLGFPGLSVRNGTLEVHRVCLEVLGDPLRTRPLDLAERFAALGRLTTALDCFAQAAAVGDDPVRIANGQARCQQRLDRQCRARCERDAVARALPGARVEATEAGLIVDCCGLGSIDLAPLAGRPLHTLKANGNGLTDLEPLADTGLVNANLGDNPVCDLAPLTDLPLESLSLEGGGGPIDLSQVARLPLTRLGIRSRRLLRPDRLADLPLVMLDLRDTDLDDLAPLAGKPLTTLHLVHTPVFDLAPITKLPLQLLAIGFTHVRDFAPLLELDLDCLSLNGLPLERLDLLPLDRLVTLSAGETRITDLAPLAGSAVRELFVHQTAIADLAPLATTRLTRLSISGSQASDLSPLANLDLNDLQCAQTPVATLAPMAGLPLRRLLAADTAISDLTPLAGCPLEFLDLSRTAVRDLGPILEAPLKQLQCRGCDLDPAQLDRLHPGCQVIR